MKNFFGEFKKFITRGHVVDMSVGVVVGGAFTAIVNGISNFVLKPLTNWLIMLALGKDSLKDIYTMLHEAYKLDDAGAIATDANGNAIVDLANSIYIDWGALINAIINFIIIAFVLFTIVKVINHTREKQDILEAKAKKGKLTKAQKKELKKAGIKRRDKAAVKAYFDEKARIAKEEAEAAEAKAKAEAEAERLANPTSEDLLKKILVELEVNNARGIRKRGYRRY